MNTQKSFVSLDIPQIDEEHRDIISTIAKFRDRISEGKSWLELYELMETIEKKAQLHFGVEENLMKIHRYPTLEKHMSEHTEYLLLLQEIKARLLRKTPSTVTADFILNWWYQHIAESDHGYADWFSTIDLEIVNRSKTLRDEHLYGSGI